MSKINKYIEIARSSTPGLSSMGQKSADMIRGVLEQYYEQVGISLVSDLSDLKKLAAKQPDLIFLGVKRVPVNAVRPSDTKIWTAAYLDQQEIAYTGSDATAIAVDYSKPAAKRLIKARGLKTAEYFIARHGEYTTWSILPLSYPLFVKPPNAGGGKGIGADSVVRDFAAFEQKVEHIYRDFRTRALVEIYLPGREFSVALLETLDSDELIAMPIELITDQNAQGDRILGQTIKAADTEHAISVPEGPTRLAVVDLAIKAFRALGARDYGRIDIRLDEQGAPHFLEANLIPGLAQHDFTSYFTTAAYLNQAMDYQSMILHITELGLSRSSLTSETPTGYETTAIVQSKLERALETV
jgi:D-alanine-D-alanine ligase